MEILVIVCDLKIFTNEQHVEFVEKQFCPIQWHCALTSYTTLVLTANLMKRKQVANLRKSVGEDFSPCVKVTRLVSVT